MTRPINVILLHKPYTVTRYDSIRLAAAALGIKHTLIHWQLTGHISTFHKKQYIAEYVAKAPKAKQVRAPKKAYVPRPKRTKPTPLLYRLITINGEAYVDGTTPLWEYLNQCAAHLPVEYNTEYAVERLREISKPTPITATNSVTGETWEFDTIIEACDYFQLPRMGKKALLKRTSVPNTTFTTAPVSPVGAFEAEDELAPEFEE